MAGAVRMVQKKLIIIQFLKTRLKRMNLTKMIIFYAQEHNLQ